MVHPLDNYRAIAKPDFIFHLEDRFYTDYHAELSSGLYVDTERDKNRMKVTGVDIYGKDFSEYISFAFFLLSEYEKLEKESRSEIDKIILTILDETKQQVFIKSIIAELQVLQNAIRRQSKNPKYNEFGKLLLRDSIRFSELLQIIYQRKKESISNAASSKVIWLGSNKQLGTLFFDLWKGQRGTKENPKNLKPLIDVKTKKQLMDFLENSFLNKKGESLKLGSLSDYLNTAEYKNDSRTTSDRIELFYK